jgi:hypothetical protein
MYGIFKFFRKGAVVAVLLVICVWLPCQGQNVAGSGVLQPLPDVVAGAPGTVVSTQHGLVWVRAPFPAEAERSSADSGLAAAGAPPPVVTYQDGQLTIDAENSTLAEVLELVAEKTGAVIDIPPGSGLERIVEHTGPGPAEDVLARLLNGSPFDFIIVGSSEHPHDPTQVLLSLHQADTPASLPHQLSTDQTSSASAQPKTLSSPYLWKPPSASAQPKTSSASPLWTPPVASSAPVLPQPLIMGAPTEPIPPDVLEQMMKDFSRQLRGQPPQ